MIQFLFSLRRSRRPFFLKPFQSDLIVFVSVRLIDWFYSINRSSNFSATHNTRNRLTQLFFLLLSPVVADSVHIHDSSAFSLSPLFLFSIANANVRRLLATGRSFVSLSLFASVVFTFSSICVGRLETTKAAAAEDQLLPPSIRSFSADWHRPSATIYGQHNHHQQDHLVQHSVCVCVSWCNILSWVSQIPTTSSTTTTRNTCLYSFVHLCVCVSALALVAMVVLEVIEKKEDLVRPLVGHSNTTSTLHILIQSHRLPAAIYFFLLFLS